MVFIPSDDRHAQECGHTAEDQRHDASRCEAGWQCLDHHILAREVQEVFRVRGCVASNGCRSGGADVVVVLGDSDGLLDVKRCFDHGRDEAAGEMPFDVTVEEPDARVVADGMLAVMCLLDKTARIDLRPESDDEVAVWSYPYCVATHGLARKDAVVVWLVEAVFLRSSLDDLEVMSVQMERMLARIVVVQHDLDNVHFVKDERIRVGAVDGTICGVHAGRQGTVQCRNLWSNVGDVVESSIVGAVTEVDHRQVQVE